MLRDVSTPWVRHRVDGPVLGTWECVECHQVLFEGSTQYEGVVYAKDSRLSHSIPFGKFQSCLQNSTEN